MRLRCTKVNLAGAFLSRLQKAAKKNFWVHKVPNQHFPLGRDKNVYEGEEEEEGES